MQVSKLLSFLFFLGLSVSFAQAPANNTCANAEVVSITTTSSLTITADFTNATESLDASCNTISVDNKDLWYQFTMPINGNLYINGPSSLNYFTLYDTCGGAELDCIKDDASFGGLVSGNTYILRASYQFGGTVNFSLQAFVPASNDECENRENLAISTIDFLQPSPDSRTASQSTSSSCDDVNRNYTDLWYELEMPVDGNLQISSSNSAEIFSLYDVCSGTELQCFIGNGIFQNLNSTTTYVLRVAERLPDVGVMNFKIQAFALANNDNCQDSETIDIETENANTYTANFIAASESSMASCQTFMDTTFDLWFDFIMPVNGNLKIDQLLGSDTVTLYDTCGGTELSCKSGSQFIFGLLENTSYILRLSTVSQSNRTPRFQAFPEAPNDECESSETISVITENPLSYQVDTRRATETLDSTCDDMDDDNLDLWYDFEMPVTGNIQISGVGFTFRTTLYDACSGNELDCFNGNGTYFNLGFGTNYKLRISQLSSTANMVSYSIQAFENIFNDECDTPLSMTVLENEPTIYSTNNAAATNSTLSLCEPPGENFAIQDVWYQFTMPSDNDIEIDHLTSSINGYYALYDSCGSTELQCINNNGFFNGLTGGNQYFLKVGNLSSQTGVFSFSISAKSETLSTQTLSQPVISIYPNPVDNIMHVSLENQTHNIDDISIYTVTGQQIKTEVNLQSNNQIEIDVSHLKNAVYFVVISSKKGKLIRKIIKQ